MPYKLCLKDVASRELCCCKYNCLALGVRPKGIEVNQNNSWACAGLRLFYRRGRAFTENLSIFIFNFRVFSTQLQNAQTSKFPKTCRMCHKKFET